VTDEPRRYDHWRCVTCGRDALHSLGGFMSARQPVMRGGTLYCCECVAHAKESEQLGLDLASDPATSPDTDRQGSA